MTREPKKIGEQDTEEHLDEEKQEKQEILESDDLPEDFPTPEESRKDVVGRAFKVIYGPNSEESTREADNPSISPPEPSIESVYQATLTKIGEVVTQLNPYDNTISSNLDSLTNLLQALTVAKEQEATNLFFQNKINPRATFEGEEPLRK